MSDSKQETLSQNRYLWLILYVACSIILTLHSKYLLNDFQYPWLLTSLHASVTYLGVKFIHTPTKLDSEQWKTIYYFSFLYTINIAISNWGLLLTNVHFHQIIRSSNPIITVILNLLYGKYTSIKTCLSLIPIVVGVMLASYGEINYSWFGLIIVWIGVILSALKGIVTNQVMVGPLKLHPLDAILKLTPLATLQCLIFASFNGEIIRLCQDPPTLFLLLMLISNAFLAYLLNMASFTAMRKNGPLSCSVAGNVKQISTILLSVLLFHISLNVINGVGIIVTIIGGIIYSSVDYISKYSHYEPLDKEMEMQHAHAK
eukprot:NODE_732_length_4354_cov_0.742656.p2 type:complete len:316 gc:universal NODE_732_length_4354_cov_0.742656:3793-2846(-)